MKFLIKNITTNMGVAEYEAEQVRNPFDVDPEYSGSNFKTYNELGQEVVPEATTRTVWTILDFLRRFDHQERIAIRALAKQDPVTEDFMDLLSKASSVASDDPDTVQGLFYMVSKGLLTQERVSQILGAN